MSSARITSFLVKVASRCNLDCDYCYVYHHADQSWRGMPKVLSAEHQAKFAERLADYVASAGLRRIAVIFHGGEPLLIGHAAIVEFARLLRRKVGADVDIDLGLQTNGLLLTDDALDAFEAERIAVSLSMDGPRAAHDLHRTSRRGRSSFDRVAAALERLKRRPAIFAGVIAVLDASVPPSDLLEFFADHAVPQVDFLLPDSHHERAPPGRDKEADRYERWLIEAFDVWLDSYPELRVRTFEALLDAAAGLASGTDAFGLGDVSLLSLETDGTWHDLDVLKVTADGATRLVGSVSDTSIEQVASSTQIAAHRRLLSKPGLCATCRRCEVVEICGGGSLPHRFGNGGFDNPSVYCRELKSLIAHIRSRLSAAFAQDDSADDLPPTFDVQAFELAETSGSIVDTLYGDAVSADVDGFRAAALSAGYDADAFDERHLHSAGRRPGAVAWQRARAIVADGRVVRDVDGVPLVVEPGYFEKALEMAAERGALEIGLEDDWLRRPFGASIIFEDAATAERGRALVVEALSIVDGWRPALGDEFRRICSAIQFVRDPSAHSDKIVSFSDDSVPGALFVSIVQGEALIDAYDLADSLIHEYRHQKLYLFERRHRTTHEGALVASPWREELRPVSGLLHAAFVFVELGRFWEHVRDVGPTRLHNRAIAQLEDTGRNLAEAFETLRGCKLTPAGRALADVLETRKRRLPLAA